MKVQASDTLISKMFSSTNRYIVPRFQRAYCWDKLDIEQLWEDINAELKVNVPGDDTSEYFIGAIVLINNEKDDNYYIVDGQQRLTTIVIILSAIIEHFKALKRPDKAKGLYNLIEGKDLNDDSAFFKLQNETPKPFFQTAIQNYKKEERKPKTAEENSLMDAFLLVNSHLEKIKQNSSLDKYLTYLSRLKDQVLALKLVHITVNSEEDACTIFETLNSTGKDLSASDLIKTSIFRVLENQHPNDEAKEKWTKVIDNLKERGKGVDINKYLLHFWASENKYSAQKNLYKSFKEKYPNTSSAKEMRTFLDSMVSGSEIYQKIFHPMEYDWPLQQEKYIYSCLRALTVFRVEQPKPLLLSLLKAKQDKKITANNLRKVLYAIENFHFVFTAICSARPSGLNYKYSSYARKIYSAKSAEEVATLSNEVIEDLRRLLPDFELFRNAFEDVCYTREKKTDFHLIKYIFNKMELNLRNTEELSIGKITIEHISPQSHRTKSVGCIGNLLPLGEKINETSDRSDFTDKLTAYSESELEVVKSFIKKNAKITSWGEAEILERTDELAGIAYKEIWTV